MEMRKYRSESDLPLNAKVGLNDLFTVNGNTRRRLISWRNKSTVGSHIRRNNSHSTADDWKTSNSSVRNAIIEVRKKLKKVSEDSVSCVSGKNVDSCAPDSSKSDIKMRHDTKGDGDKSHDSINKNVSNLRITEEEGHEKEGEEEEEEEDEEDDDDEEYDEEEEDDEETLKEVTEIAASENEKLQIVNTDGASHNDHDAKIEQNTDHNDKFQIIETILSSAVTWIHFLVLTIWLATLILWYALPLVGVQDSVIDHLIITDELHQVPKEGVVRDYLLKMKRNLFDKNC